MSDETEIKLAIREEGLAAATKLFGKDEPVQIHSTYFDTPDLLLRRHGIQLRLRHDGDEVLQTVKLSAGSVGPMTRAEHEISLDHEELDIPHLMEALPEEVREALRVDALRPLFVTRFERRRHLSGPGKVVELAFDRGMIESGEKQLPVLEIEAELKGPDFDAYIAEVLALLDKVPASIIASGKAARGYRLATGTTEAPVYPPKLELPPGIALPDAIKAILRQNFARFFENIPAAQAGIPGGIHQVRVGLRRLRSTVAAFKPVMRLAEADGLLREVKALFNAFEPVREADVFVADTLPKLVEAGMKPKLAATVAERIAEFRAREQAKVTALLQSTETAKLIVRLYGWIESGRWMKFDRPLDLLLDKRQAADFARPRLRKLHKALLRKARKARNSTDLDDWHRARIAAKKLRYAADPLLPTLDLPPEVALTYRKSIEAIQGELGQLNDIVVAERFLETVKASLPARQRQPLAKTLGLLEAWQARTSDQVLVEAAREIRIFEKNGFPRNKKRKK